MSDLAATFDAHVQAEFQDLDLEATMSTSSANGPKTLKRDGSRGPWVSTSSSTS